MLTPGVRVVRGPNWCWKEQDGGEGFVGTVCEVGKSGSGGSPDKTVVVQWDSGTRTNYRVGYQGQYDLRVIDNAQIGIKHPNIICDGCKVQGIAGMRYKCTLCYDYDLCSLCYHADVHDLSHPFQRFDYFGSHRIDVPLRKNSAKCHLRGIFVGAKVVRGHNWEWNDQDGGEGRTGRVIDIRGWDNESARSVANVAWVSGKTNVYRIGHKGNCDIKFVQEASGGYYYPEHVPVLGLHVEPAVQSETRAGPVLFTVGDKVKVKVDVDTLKAMQQGHGGWNPKMAECVGKTGTVHRVTERGDIRVQYEGCNNRWTFNPAALSKVNGFTVGDVISVINDVERVKELQKGHGEWVDIMKNVLGKLGKVLKVYDDGDLKVQLDGHAWTLNPQCVRVVPGSAAELANTMNAMQNQRQEPSMQWLENNAQSNGNADQLVRAAAQGQLEVVMELLDANPGSTDLRSGGKTCLQVAAHQGHLSLVKLLLARGANVNASDTDGDTCLHYAAFGNQPEVLDLLLKAGAALNTANRGGCTALHIAAHKQPSRCVQLLLASGADPNARDLYGDTPLHDAVGKDSYQVIEMLCNATGTDFTLRNERGFNVLHHAALKGKDFATRKLLAKARQLVDIKKDDGFSPLHLAALNGHRDVVGTLVRLGQADVDLRNNRNQSALLLAVSQGHCGVVELLVNLRANINARDEDGDTALHLALIKRANLTAEITHEEAPAIHAICEEQEGRVHEHRTAIAIACYLIKMSCDTDAVNAKNQTAIALLQDVDLQELLKSYKPSVDHAVDNLVVDFGEHMGIGGGGNDNDGGGDQDQEHQSASRTAANSTTEGFNLTEGSPSRHGSPARLHNGQGEQHSPRKSRSESRRNRENSRESARENVVVVANSNCSPATAAVVVVASAKENCSNVANDYYVVSRKPVECFVCSDLSEENVKLEPCGHKPACEDCASRMKKCLHCGVAVQKRITKDGRVIPAKSRQPSAERMRYLESKIQEIEESHACSICMERRRNVVFLCGHGTCSKCADTLKTCHMCRQPITKKIPIY